jgi:hypothetical membrane protein
MSVPGVSSNNLPTAAATIAVPGHAARTAALRKQLPYACVLALTLVGVAYTSYSKRPIVGYWEFLTLVMGVLCVSTGWQQVQDKEGRIRLVWTQALHWLAFLIAMNLVLLTGMRTMLNADAMGLAILMLLALGTFVAGVHTRTWEVCALGAVMALSVPAIAWVEQSALLLLLGAGVVLAIGVAIWWNTHKKATAR